MMNKIRFLIIIFLPILLLPSCCDPPLMSTVSIKLIPQERDCWCWAATTEMISDYYGNRIPQCESVNYVHGDSPDCCTGCKGNCQCWGWDWAATITQIQNNWQHWNFDYDYTASELSWDKIKKTVSTSSNCCKSPIQAVWWWKPLYENGGHVIVIYGYAEIGNNRYVAYYNPLPESCNKSSDNCTTQTGGSDVITTYENFVSSAAHEWGNSFYQFESN